VPPWPVGTAMTVNGETARHSAQFVFPDQESPSCEALAKRPVPLDDQVAKSKVGLTS